MKNCMLNLALLMLCLSLSVVTFAADWPQFRGPTANGIAPDQGINKNWAQRPPEELWQVALGGDAYAGPAVAGGKVYIIAHEGDQDVVRALDLTTGQEVWRFNYPDTADAGSNDSGFARSTPLISEGNVYTLSRLGSVHCLDAETGAKLWSRNIQTDFGGQKPRWDYSMSPIVDGNKLILCPGGNDAGVVALDKNTGDTIWAGGGSDVPGYATPVVAEILGLRQYVVFTGVGLIGVAADSGQLLWRFPWKTSYDVNAATPLVAGNRILISSGYKHGCAMVEITPQGPESRWENTELQAQFSSPVAYNGHIYGVGDPGVLVCLDPATGAALWKQPGFEKGGLCAIDGVLLVMTGNSGKITMVNAVPTGYEELGQIKPLEGQSWTAPIVTDGKLLVRNRAALVCLDLK